MVKSTQSFQNFSAGELSPRMRGRFDIPLYFSGHERVENFIVEAQGPARYRTGLRFADTTYKNNPAVLVPFVYNDEQSYMLELTDSRGRIYTDGGLLNKGVTLSITAISQASLAVVTFSGAHGLATGDEILITGIPDFTAPPRMSLLNGQYFTVTYLTPTDVGINYDTSTYGAYGGSGGEAVQIVHFIHPYLEAELFAVRTAQQSDAMYLTHRNHPPQKLVRTSATVWTFGTFARTADPFGAGNYPAAVTFFEQRTWYGGTDTNPQTFWASAASSYDDMTTGTSATSGFTATLATKQTNVIRWIEGNEDLLIFGANGGNIKFSGGSTGITPTNFQSKPLDFLGGAAISPIIKDKRIIFTQQDRRKLRVLDFDFETDSYEPVDLTKIADHITTGDVKQMAYQDGRPDVVWCVKEDGELIGLTYDPRESIIGWHRHTTGKELGDTFESVAVLPQIDTVDQVWTVVQRLIDGSVKHYVEYLSAEPEYPERIDYFTGVKATDADNYGLALYEKQREYFHVDSGLTYDGSLRSSYFDFYEVTYDGIDCYRIITGLPEFGSVYTERNGLEIYEKDGPGRARVFDSLSSSDVYALILVPFSRSSGSRYQNGEWYLTTGTISGLEHLEGREVAIVTDGAVHPTEIVTDGAILLDYQAAVVHVGLAYDGIIKTNNLESGSMDGAAHGKTKNVHKCDIRFLNTLGASFGEDVYNMQSILFRSTNSLMGRPPELFSGIREVKFPGSHGKDKKIIIKQRTPLPCTVQFIGVNMTTGAE